MIRRKYSGSVYDTGMAPLGFVRSDQEIRFLDAVLNFFVGWQLKLNANSKIE